MPKSARIQLKRAVGRIEQPQPGERAHGRRDDPRHQQHAAPLALALRRNVVHEVGDHEADDRLEDHRGDGEQAGLVDDQPEGVAAEQELEVPEADEARHALVQRREVDRRSPPDRRPASPGAGSAAAPSGRRWSTCAASACAGLLRRSPVRTAGFRAAMSAMSYSRGKTNDAVAGTPRSGGVPNGCRTTRQLREKPSSSLAAQSSVLSMASPLAYRTTIWVWMRLGVDLLGDLVRRRAPRRSRASGGCAGSGSGRACPSAALPRPRP